MTKTARKAQASALLAKWKGKGPISEPQDVTFLTELLDGHVNATQKIGCGVAHFFVGPATFGTFCFHVRRLDGSTTDFGISACLDDTRRLNLASFRDAVANQVNAYRSQFTGTTFTSELSGQTFPIEQLHIDHAIPFLQIVDRFAKERGLDLAVLLTEAKDMSFVPVWKDPAIPAAFATFHAQFPLRAVSRWENLSVLRKREPAPRQPAPCR